MMARGAGVLPAEGLRERGEQLDDDQLCCIPTCSSAILPWKDSDQGGLTCRTQDGSTEGKDNVAPTPVAPLGRPAYTSGRCCDAVGWGRE